MILHKRNRPVQLLDSFNDLIKCESISTPGVDVLTYTYDDNKNLTSETHSGVMASHSWSTGATGIDAEDRIVSWTRTNGESKTWSMSPVGDWNSSVINGSMQTRTHGAGHEILTMSGSGVPGGTATLTHDSKGNLTTDERGCAMEWDLDSRLESFGANGIAGLSDATFEYDAIGRRVAKTTTYSDGSAETRVFIHEGELAVSEFVGGSSVNYVFGESRLPLFRDDSSSDVFLLHDRNSNVFAVTDSSGGVLENYAYGAYGELTVATPQGTTIEASQVANFKTNGEFDAESKLVSTTEGVYAANLGRKFAGYIQQQEQNEPGGITAGGTGAMSGTLQAKSECQLLEPDWRRGSSFTASAAARQNAGQRWAFVQRVEVEVNLTMGSCPCEDNTLRWTTSFTETISKKRGTTSNVDNHPSQGPGKFAAYLKSQCPGVKDEARGGGI